MDLEFMRENLLVRKKIKDGTDEYKGKWKSLISRSFEDFILYIGWTYDPRREPMDFPFQLYPFQVTLCKELVEAYENQHDLLIEKSRDMGVSWIVLYFIYWEFMFGERFSALLGSKKEANVDKKGDITTLFEKIRYAVHRTPKWLLPDGWNNDEHMQYLKMTHPNGNLISGESANKDFSRSGRYSLVMMDEFASWDYGEEAWRASADATNVRIPISTPKGISNEFARIRHEGKIKVLTLHWKDHPLKNKNLKELPDGKWTSDWYKQEELRRSKKDLAQELDIQYHVVTGNSVFCQDYEIVQGNPEDKPKDALERFAIGVDCATGTGKDWSIATVVNKETNKQVFIIRSREPLDVFAVRVAELGEKWNNALVAPEINGIGLAFIQKFKTIYKYLYYRKDWDRSAQRIVPRLGWQTTRKTKPIMIDDLDEALRYGLKVTHKETIDEIKVMEYDDNEAANAPAGFNDDCVVALAIAVQALKDVRRPIRGDDADEIRKKRKKRRYIGTRSVNMITGKKLTKV